MVSAHITDRRFVQYCTVPACDGFFARNGSRPKADAKSSTLTGYSVYLTRRRSLWEHFYQSLARALQRKLPDVGVSCGFAPLPGVLWRLSHTPATKFVPSALDLISTSDMRRRHALLCHRC